MSKHEDSFLGFIPKYQDKITGAYKLIHVKTGKFYVGSTANFYERRVTHIVQLRRNEHHCKKLQELYREDPHFKFEFFLAGRDEKARKLAFDTEQMLLDEYAKTDLLLNDSTGAELAARNKTPESRKKVSEFMKAFKGTPEFRAQQAQVAADYWKDPEYRKKKSKRISIDGVIYSSILEASKALGIHTFTIGHRLKNKKPQFDNYKYLDNEGEVNGK
jgi:hypothetical protein